MTRRLSLSFRKRARFALIAPAALAALAALPSNASADVPGFAVDRFNPSERGSEWFANDSLDIRGGVRPAIGVVVDWAHKPLVLYAPDGHEVASVIKDQVFLHPGASLVLADRFRLAFNLPIAVYQQGDLVGGQSVNGVTSPSKAALGDLRLSADARLFGTYGDPITMAFGASVFLPTGDRNQFAGDGQVRVEPHLMAAGDLSVFTYAARLGFMYRGLDDRLGGAVGAGIGSEFTFGVAAGLRVARVFTVGPEIYGSTVVTATESAFSKKNTPFEGLLGGHLTFAKDFRIGAGFGPGFTRGFGAPELRVVGSLEYAPAYCKDDDNDGVCAEDDACPNRAGIKTNDPRTNGCPSDRDHDGIYDDEDACPDDPGPRTNDPRTNGCPDRDGDGIPDKEDACPDVPGIRTNDPRTNGCPPDRDRDGIPDNEDACPDVPGVRTNNPKTNGCPPDRDGDGITDLEDACPDNPGPRRADPKTNGCPDRDGDGIMDKDDACPDQPGPPSSNPKENGCPPAYLEGNQIKILQQVKFRFGLAVLDPASDPVLNAVADILVNKFPKIKTVRVEGHTDSVGPASVNTPLSKARAKAVVEWLVAHGVARTRLVSDGFGPTRPIDSNDTPEGRQNNRRTEFHIVDDGNGGGEGTGGSGSSVGSSTPRTQASGGAAAGASTKPAATPAKPATPPAAPAPAPKK